MKNPYDPPTLNNCHNTLKEAFNEGTETRDEWWIEKLKEIIPNLQEGYTLGAITRNNQIEEIFVADDDGDEISDTAISLKKEITHNR
jgi:hypothetical protein